MSTSASPVQVMRRDRFRLDRGRLSPGDQAASADLVARRAALLEGLDTDLNPQLPVSEAEADILAALSTHPVVIVAGETGSGKTTQIPKLCLRLGLGVTGMIGHTQPRRLAARTVATRIAEETGGRMGTEIASAVRFSDVTGEETLVRVMTDGLLLNELGRDRFLEAYDAIIIDEAHERSLNIDFLLGYLKRLLAKRRDLKVVVTSATIDVDRFSAFFDGAPIVAVGGRTFPVEVEYQGEPADRLDAICDALDDIETRPHQGASDVLIFLPGERDILETAKGLRERYRDRLELLPLYARLSLKDQQAVFRGGGARRRVVLSTNVAETSLTVPNIGFVIDTGVARINRYSYKSKLTRLPIEPISQASADQRKGRCGRIAPGVCFRLYAEEDFLSRPAFSDPEIRRVNLASVVLQMESMRLGSISRFPFIEPPDPRAVKDALRLLDELGALEGGKLTRRGRQMSRLPVDPRLARMLLAAADLGALSELLVIASALSVQDPRERPLEKRQAADQAHARWQDERSDFIGWLNLWRWLDEARAEKTNNQFQRHLRKSFLSPLRVREWREVHRQLRSLCRDLGLRENEQAAGYAAIHESVVAGSLSLVALHDEKGHYQGARNLKLRIFPGSGLEKTPRWIVAAEIAETTRVYARSVAKIEPVWVERQATHLIKTSVTDPHWSLKRGEVMASASLSLYGLRLAENRRVRFAAFDPDEARRLFIRDGLVAGALERPPDFLSANLALIARVIDVEQRLRRRDILVSDDQLQSFYESRLPDGIVGAKTLARWLRGKPEHDERLRMTEADLRQSQTDFSEDEFPSEIEFDGARFTVRYRFAPGDREDGVTLEVPVGLLQALNGEALEWSVPGFFALVVEDWLRTLPKQKRKRLAPMPDKVEALVKHLTHPDRYRRGRFLTALARALKDFYQLEVQESDWDADRVSPHLRFNVRLLGPDGKVIKRGRDLKAIKAASRGQTDSGRLKAAVSALEQRALSTLPDLEDSVFVEAGGAPVMKFPGLAVDEEGIHLKMFTERSTRDVHHRLGLSRLAQNRLGQVSRYFRKELDRHPKLGLHFAPLGDAQALKRTLLDSIVWFHFFEGREPLVDQSSLADRLERLRGTFASTFEAVVRLFAEIVEQRFDCLRALDDFDSPAFQRSNADARSYIERLAPATVLEVTPYRYLPLVPRYLAGLKQRLDRLPGHVPTDLKRMDEIEPLEARLQRFGETELFDPERAADIAFLLHEMRLQLFCSSTPKLKPHPLDQAFFGGNWRASTKRVAQVLREEEERLGLV